MQRHAELFVGFQQLGVYFGQALGPLFEGLGCRVIAQGLEVDGIHLQSSPGRGLHGLPALERGQAPLQQKVRFALAQGDCANRVLVQARGQGIGFNVCNKTVLVGAFEGLNEWRGLFGGARHGASPSVAVLSQWGAWAWMDVCGVSSSRVPDGFKVHSVCIFECSCKYATW